MLLLIFWSIKKYYFDYVTVFERVNPNSRWGVLEQFQIRRGEDDVSRYFEKKKNLLSSEVGHIAWLRPLPRHKSVETLGWWNEPNQIDQH